MCRVVDAEKLPAESGGADALCGAIRQAAAAQGIGGQFAVEVRVLSPSLLSATVTAPSGERLPEQRLVSADRELRASSFRRFAQSLVRLARQPAR